MGQNKGLLMISFMMKFQSRVGHQLEAVLKPIVIYNGECGNNSMLFLSNSTRQSALLRKQEISALHGFFSFAVLFFFFFSSSVCPNIR